MATLLASEPNGAPSLLGGQGAAGHAHHAHHGHQGHDQAATRAHAQPAAPVIDPNQASVYISNSDGFQLHPDGSYSYRYELSDGSFSFVNADAAGELAGGFGYKDLDGGDDVSLEYTSGTGGFLPNGCLLYTSPSPRDS